MGEAAIVLKCEGLQCCFWGNARVPVPVATHPRAEPERHRVRICSETVELCRDRLQDNWKNFCGQCDQVVESGSCLVDHAGLLQSKFIRLPDLVDEFGRSSVYRRHSVRVVGLEPSFDQLSE